MKPHLEYDRITPRVAEMSVAEVDRVVRAYALRRLQPRPERGGQREWARSMGLTGTDVYGVLQRAGHTDLVGGTREDAQRYIDEHHLLDEPTTPTPTRRPQSFMAATMPISSLTLDGALLEQMIRAEITRVVTSMRGEIEQHVRKETQAAVERATERGVSTLMRSLETTMDQIIEAAVTRALDEYTSG